MTAACQGLPDCALLVRRNSVRALVWLDLHPIGRRLTDAGYEAVGRAFARHRATGWWGRGYVKARVRRAEAGAFVADLTRIASEQTTEVLPW